jgi:hypothetical protein
MARTPVIMTGKNPTLDPATPKLLTKKNVLIAVLAVAGSCLIFTCFWFFSAFF